jgi:predicted lipoprotein with Yx(FWY)xxD motif
MDLADKNAIIETVCKMTFYADRRDFAGLSSCYGKVFRQYDMEGKETGSQTKLSPYC